MNLDGVLEAAKNGSIMHALLISGQEGSGIVGIAERLCASFLFQDENLTAKLANSPGFMEFGRNEPITVAMVRDMVDNTAMQSFDQGKRAYLFIGAHRMNEQSQNALLKTLEEPPSGTLIVLCGSETGLLSTIRSRCSTVRIGSETPETVKRKLEAEGVPSDAAGNAAYWSDGNAGLADTYTKPEYMAFRKEVYGLLTTAFFTRTPFMEMQKLLKSEIVKEAEVPESTEEMEGEAQGKKKASRTNAGLILRILSDVARDAVVIREGGTNLLCPDAIELTRKVASDFTTSRILGIISKIAEAEKSLLYNANPSIVLDALLLSLIQEG